MRLLPAAWVVAGVVSGATVAAASPPQLAIAHRLVAEFVGAEQAQGTIVLSLTNHSNEPLRGLMLRLADPSDGQLTGAVNEKIELAPHETRTVHGHFQLDPAALAPDHGIEWQVVYRDAEGYSLQARVASTSLTAPALARTESTASSTHRD
jgi:hypothetical protein